MPYFQFFWTPALVQHLMEHDVSEDEFEDVVCHSNDHRRSRSSGDKAVVGIAFTGRRLFCVDRMIGISADEKKVIGPRRFINRDLSTRSCGDVPNLVDETDTRQPWFGIEGAFTASE